MTEGRYRAHGPQAEFEPGSGGRVLRNLLAIKRVHQIEQAESEALLALDFTPLVGRGPLTSPPSSKPSVAIMRRWKSVSGG